MQKTKVGFLPLYEFTETVQTVHIFNKITVTLMGKQISLDFSLESKSVTNMRLSQWTTISLKMITSAH